jgi:RHS repeat-associated protein
MTYKMTLVAIGRCFCGWDENLFCITLTRMIRRELMRKIQFINEQNLGIDRESPAHVVAATAKKHKVSSHTIYLGQGTAHLPWTYYLLGPSNEQLAVWNGFAGAACGTTVNTVRLWPIEYHVYVGGERTIVRLNGNRELVMSNHLGSTANIFPLTGLNRTPIAQQVTDAYGVPVTLQGAVDPQRSRTSFIGRDVDKESDLGAFGARLYSSEYGRFMPVDKMMEKYATWTSYIYSADPLRVIDPNGLEGIVLTGQPGKHDNKQHVLINGLDRARKSKKCVKKGECVTWIIYDDGSKTAGQDKKRLQKYIEMAKAEGINIKVVNSVDKVIDYVNEKDGGDSRTRDKVSNFYYIGHATEGELCPDYTSGQEQDLDPADFNADAFSKGCWVNLVGGCSTESWVFLEESAAREFAHLLGPTSRIVSSSTSVLYLGGVMTDEQLMRTYKGRIVEHKGDK